MDTTMAVKENFQLTEEEFENEKNESVTNFDFKMIGFSLAGKDYAIDIMKVKEIAKAGKFTYVPNTDAYVLGVYNLRGDIIPIIDLRVFFNIEVPERTTNDVENLIIVKVQDRVFGVVVDGIDKVVGIQKKRIQPPHPLFGDINIKYIYGVVESNEHLYILLDIDRVFGLKSTIEADEQNENNTDGDSESIDVTALKNDTVDKSVEQKTPATKSIFVAEDKEPDTASVEKDSNTLKTKIPQAKIDDSEENIGYSFLVDALAKFSGFYVSELNKSWVERSYEDWVIKKGNNASQITTVEQANEFLSSFYSRYTNELWQEDYYSEIMALLPDNSAKQINIWNPGCGKGYETFSLACVFFEKYPNSKIKIYAQDLDLLNISNAPLLTFTEDKIPAIFKPYMVKTVKGTYSFSQKVKDSIQFEYHDCTHNNATPSVDFILIRDLLSFIDPDKSQGLLLDIEDNLKGNGTIIIGDNEVLTDHSKWLEDSKGSLTIYSKS